MLQMIQTAAPIYLIVAVGYGAARTGFLPAAVLTPMGLVAIRLCLPVLVFRAILLSPPGALNAPFMLAYAAASVAVLVLGMLFARAALRTGPAEGWILGWGMANSNSGFLGLPLALAIFGDDAVLVFAMTMIVENVLVIPLALTAAALVAGGGQGMGRRLVGVVVGNPLILAILAALGMRALGWVPPAPVLRTMGYLADAAPAISLLVIGGILSGLSMQGYWRRVSAVAVGKLVVHPALVLAAFMVVPGVPPDLVAMGMLFAAVPMLTVYPLFAQAHGLEKVASAALFVTTLAGALSVPLVMALVSTL